jgi:hypothetical protein
MPCAAMHAPSPPSFIPILSLFLECLRYRNLPDEEKRVEEVPEVRTLVSKKWLLKEVIDAFN